MIHHLTHKPKAPWHWDGHDPLDKPVKRVVAQSPAPTKFERENNRLLDAPEPEGWDIDGLGR